MAQHPQYMFGAGGNRYPPGTNPNHTPSIQQHQQGGTFPPATNPAGSASLPLHELQMALPPGADMSALAGISPQQMALIAQLFQSGALPMPPPPPAPSHSLGHSSHAQPSDFATLGPAYEASLPANPMPTHHSKQPEIESTEREEGELEENGIGAAQDQCNFRYSPPSGPRQSTHRIRHEGAIPRSQAPVYSDIQHSGQYSSHKIQDSTAPYDTSRANDLRRDKSYAAERFVLAVVDAGYTFDELAREIGDATSLRKMFQDLGLSVPSGSTLPSSSIDGGPQTQEPVAKPSAPKRTLPVKLPAVNRTEYLARLQAARNKKSDAPVSVSQPESQPLELDNSKHAVVDAQTPQQDPARASATSKADKNELLRQKLAAVKAEYAAKQAAKRKLEVSGDASAPRQTATPDSAPAPFDKPDDRLEARSNSATHIQHVSHVSEDPTPASGASVKNSLGGLPGLFMTVKPTSASAASPFATPNATTRKRPVASDFDDPPSDFAGVKRPFGQSRNQSEDESIVIEDSDDSDADEDVEVRGIAQSLHRTQPLREAAPLRDFPSHSKLSSCSSAPATPGNLTPGGSQYQRVVQDIEAMNRKIAEMEKKKVGARGNGNAQLSLSHTPVPTDAATFTPQQQFTAPVSDVDLVMSNAAFDAVADQSEARTKSAESSEERSVSNSESSDLYQEGGEHPNLYHDFDVPEPEHGPRTTGEPTIPSQETAALHPRIDDAASEISDDSISNFYNTQSAQPDIDAQSREENHANLPGTFGDDEHMLTSKVTTDDSIDWMNSKEPSPALDIEDDLPDDASTSSDASMSEGSDSSGPSASPRSDKFDHRENETGVAYRPTTANISQTSELLSRERVPKASVSSGSGTDGLRNADDDSESSKQMAQVHSPATPRPADDLAPELQPLQSQQVVVNEQISTATPTYYRPYSSPLAMFKNFCYHPDFLTIVPGGFRSLTYSHKIDEREPLCRYEAAGGQCNDPSCDSQHFASMVLTDKELLESFCKKNIPVHNAAEENEWNTGLANLIKDLKAKSLGNNVDSIALPLVEFRRRFVGDPTKILNLG